MLLVREKSTEGKLNFLDYIKDPFVRPLPMALSPLQEPLTVPRSSGGSMGADNAHLSPLRERESFQVITQVFQSLATSNDQQKGSDSCIQPSNTLLTRLTTVTDDNAFELLDTTSLDPPHLNASDSWVDSVMAPSSFTPDGVQHIVLEDPVSSNNTPTVITSRRNTLDLSEHIPFSESDTECLLSGDETQTAMSLARADTEEIVDPSLIPSLSKLNSLNPDLSTSMLTSYDTAEIDVFPCEEPNMTHPKALGGTGVGVSTSELNDESSFRKPRLVRMHSSKRSKAHDICNQQTGLSCPRVSGDSLGNQTAQPLPKNILCTGSKPNRLNNNRKVSFTKLVKVNTSGVGDLKLSPTSSFEEHCETPSVLVKQRKLRRKQQKDKRKAIKDSNRLRKEDNSNYESMVKPCTVVVTHISSKDSDMRDRRRNRRTAQQDVSRFKKTWSFRSKSRVAATLVEEDVTETLEIADTKVMDRRRIQKRRISKRNQKLGLKTWCLRDRLRPSTGKEIPQNEELVQRERNLREELNSSTFTLEKCLSWSPWYLAICPSDQISKGETTFKASRMGHSGVIDENVFQDDLHHPGRPTIYELAVSLPCADNSPLATFFKVKDSALIHKSWETVILEKNKTLIGLVENALGQGCKVYIRRAIMWSSLRFPDATVTCANGLRSIVNRWYNYAWCARSKDGKEKTPRKIVLRDINISI